MIILLVMYKIDWRDRGGGFKKTLKVYQDGPNDSKGEVNEAWGKGIK